MKTISLLCMLLIAVISGCSAFRGPLGPKLYENAFVVIKSDNALVQQQSSDKEFKKLQQSDDQNMLKIVHARLNEFTEDELASQGDLKAVQECKPKTIKITQDIQSISVSNLINVKHKFGWSHSATGTQSDDVRVSISTTIEDCESGKRLGKFTYENNGQDIIAIVKTLASWNVSESYKYQHGPRP